MRVQAVKIQHQRRSPFIVLLRIAEHELESIDEFLHMAQKARRSQQQSLERLAAKFSGNAPDEWLVDDFTQLYDFASLSDEFAIIGLWRCIELYRARAKRAMRAASRSQGSSNRNRRRGIAIFESMEGRIRCARSMSELRCLNNSIKHAQRVDGDLAKFWRWKNKKGESLGDLQTHYERLRPYAKCYLDDLEAHLNRWWNS